MFEKDITDQELHESALQFAEYLRVLGMELGDCVAIMLPSCPQKVIAYNGISMAGGNIVEINTLSTERELHYQLADSEAKIIVILDIHYPKVMRVFKETLLENVIVTRIKDYLPFPKNLVYPFIQKKQYEFSVKVEHSGPNHLFLEIMKQTSKKTID